MENVDDQPTDKATETEVPVAEETAEVSMADVAKKYNVDKLSTEFVAKPNTPQSPPVQYVPPVPDPITQPEEFSKYNLQQQQYVTGTLRELGEQVQQISKRAQQVELDAEVNQAVAKVNSKLNIDKSYTEILLEKRYRDDQVFKSIWDNRKLNPKALDEALEVITHEAKGIFQIKTDPQLQENIRAAKASTQTRQSTSAKDSIDERMMNMNDAEFEREWTRIKRGY